MNPFHPLFAIVIFSIAFLTAYLLNLYYKLNTTTERYESIDGLRGFLALGVFIHHASIWYQYLQTGEWGNNISNLYNQLGETSVSLFFMITSFLFITKLLGSAEKGINWKAFFISRIFRLVPLYYASLAIIIVYIFILSNWQLNVSVLALLKSIFHWAGFTILSSYPINDFKLLFTINAGVVWSLPYEWLFYFSLPVLSLFILKVKPNIYYLIISVAFILTYLIMRNTNPHHIVSFLGGAMAPFLMKYASPKIKSDGFFASSIVLVCIILLGQFNTASNITCKIIITIIFTFIASGNTLFGLLKNSTLKFLGEISYSTYLLHGIIIFTVIYFGIGVEKVKTFSSLDFSILIFMITPFVVLISFLSYSVIEKPFINKAKRIIKNTSTQP